MKIPRIFGLVLTGAAVTLLVTCSGSARRSTVRSADGTSIVYETFGSGEPALVFVHGWSGNRSNWKRQIAHFAADRMVVTLDLAGFGASGHERTRWTVGNYAEDVVAVVQALDIDHAILVGHSLGSGVTLEAALLMPDRVIGLVPVDVFHNVEEKLTEEEISQRADRLMNNVNNPDREYLEAAFNHRLEADAIDEILRSYESSPKIGWRESLLEYMTWRSNDLTDALGRIQAPIICINSGRRTTEVEVARRYAPAFSVSIIDGVNHAIMVEAPQQFNSTLGLIIEEQGWERDRSRSR